MNIEQSSKYGVEQLQGSSTSPHLDSEILLAHTLNTSREHIFAHPKQELTPEEYAIYSNLINQRCNGTPIAYLVGKKEFFGDKYIVTPDVLIPRPETETILEFTFTKIAKLKKLSNPLHVADIGTGSGAIAITLAKTLNNSLVYASDVSKEALGIAQKNLAIHQEVQNLEIIESNLLDAYPDVKLDLIVANLPYLSEEVYQNEPSIQFEPKEALVAKDNGMFFYKKLFKQLAPFINEKLYLVLEIDPHQYLELRTELLKHFSKSNIEPIYSEDGSCKLGLFAEVIQN